MKIATSEIINKIDKMCAEEIGIKTIILMENAALKLLKNMETDKYNNYSIVCGSGNNGGDGLALARHLYVLGKNTNIFIINDDINKLSECTKINYDILKKMGLSIQFINKSDQLKQVSHIIAHSEVTVDALFGTGVKRNIEGVAVQVIKVINDYGKIIVSVDIPSGIESDRGKIMGAAVRADKTICLELYKRGFLNYEAHEYLGEVIVESIGIPKSVIESFHQNEFITEKNFIKENMKTRKKYSHKGEFGKVSIVAGSEGFSGAAYIAAKSSVRAGSGLVTAITSKKVQTALSYKLTEAMTMAIEDKQRVINCIKESDAIGFGPGIGDNEENYALLETIIDNSDCPIVIDADGINIIAKHKEKLALWNNPIIITPHLGEMSRLIEKSIDYIRENRIDIAKEFAKKYNIVVLLKGFETVITDGETVYINPTGNSAMANGGMGDCLTGIVASFIGQGLPVFEAAVCGAYIHGFAGDELAKNMSVVNASDIMEVLPYHINQLLK